MMKHAGLLICGALAATCGALAADSARLADPQLRSRLQRNLEAFHHLSPAMQAKIRDLDRTLNDEDAVTRQRLIGIMHRYAGWLSRLNDDDRERIAQTEAGPERLGIVRQTLDRQWFADLPKPLRDEYTARPDERAALVEKWKAADREQRTARAEALREVEFGPPLDRAFREQLQKWVRESLEPKLNQRERMRLNQANHAPWINWLQQIAALSARHDLKPPGPPEFWKRLAERNKRRP